MKIHYGEIEILEKYPQFSGQDLDNLAKL